jgi:two-component system response regulator NreC
MRVLLVDNNSLLVEGVIKLLENVTDIKIIGVARDKQEALDRIEECKPDVVVIGIRSPIHNGIRAIHQIKGNNPKARILVLTSLNSIETIRMTIEAGATGYLLKQCSFNDFVSALRALNEGNSYFHPLVSNNILNGLVQTANGSFNCNPAEVALTERELEILRLVAEGLTNSQIAKRLFISEKTVQTHRRNIMDKLGFHDRVDLVKYAILKGMIAL